MSISYTVEDLKLLRKNGLVDLEEYVPVEVYPNAKDLIPYPSDYQISSCLLPKTFERYADQFENFEVRPDDVWVVTFPKSGTTWTMNIVWQLMNNLDFSAGNVLANYNYFEIPMFFDETKTDNDRIKYIIKAVEKRFQLLENLPSPRLIKSHLPAQLLPKGVWTVKPRIIYVSRDPKDTAISLYHYYRNITQIQYTGTMEKLLDLFMNDRIPFTPYCSHIKSYLQLNKLDNILLLNYQDMKKKPFAEVKKISDFLKYEYTDDQLDQLTEHVSFKNMHKRNNVDIIKYENGFNFYRKGEVGGYRDEMSPEYVQRFDEWEKKRIKCDNSTN